LDKNFPAYFDKYRLVSTSKQSYVSTPQISIVNNQKEMHSNLTIAASADDIHRDCDLVVPSNSQMVVFCHTYHQLAAASHFRAAVLCLRKRSTAALALYQPD
jgi:hypothetical protein